MKLKELYNKPIDRAVNPAVSATKFDPETERIEIQEYVVGSALGALPHFCGRFPRTCPRTVLTCLHVHGSPL